MYWHKRVYSTNLGKERFQKKVKELIGLQRKNTLKTHYSEYKSSDSRVRGEWDEDSFILWRTSGMSGLFYPIFKGRYFKVNGENVLEVKIRFNFFAEIIVSILGSFFLYLSLVEIMIKSSKDLPFWFLLIAGSLFFFIFQAVPLSGYYDLKNQTLKDFKEYFELTKLKKGHPIRKSLNQLKNSNNV